MGYEMPLTRRVTEDSEYKIPNEQGYTLSCSFRVEFVPPTLNE